MSARRFSSVAAAALLGGLFAAGPALAVVRNDDMAGNPADFPCAVKIGTVQNDGTTDFFCSGTVICDGKYVITAAHCFENESTLGKDWRIMNQAGVTLSGASVIRPHPTADIGIICLDGMFNDFYNIYMGVVMDMEVCFTGFGSSSSVATGGGPGTGMAEIPFGTPRTGYNVIDQGGLGADEVGFDFDNPGLGGREGTTFGGDSGAGYLKDNNGTIELMAVHSGIIGAVNTYGVVSVGTNLQPYKDWINAKGLPEPSTIAMAALGAGCVLGRRWWGGRKRAA